MAKRKRFTNAQKISIVIAANACSRPGEIGALMRRHGEYSSSLSTWRRQYAA
jgi:transposase|uniref:transposase n=1 Tax=Orrella sp. TaxID=1921583 RepID=UPI0040483900